MAETQNPVLVDDDKEDAVTPEQDNRTVGERIEAGELALANEGEGAVTTDESGRLRIPITPVRLTPKPEASVPTVTEFQKAIPPVTFKSLQPAATQSVTQVEEPARTYEDILKALDAGESVTIDGFEGKTTLSGPNDARLIRTPPMQKQIRLDLAAENAKKIRKASEEYPTDPTIAFVTTEGEIDVSYLDPDLQDSATAYAEGRKALDDTLRPLINTGRPDIDVAIRQYFVDDFTTGEFFDNLQARLVETSRAIPTLPQYAVMAAASATEAVRRSYIYGTDFSDEWAALAPRREEDTKEILQGIADFLPGPSAAMHLNEELRKRIKADPNLTEEQKDDFLYDTTVTGEKFLREFVNDETAYAAIEEAFNQMNGMSQFGVMFAENMLGGGILSKTKNAQAANELKRLDRLRKQFDLPADASFESIQKEALRRNKKIKLNQQLAELGQYNKTVGTQMDEAADRIKKLTSDLETAALEEGRDSLAYRRIESEIENLRRMRRRNYFKQKVSPYLVEVAGAEATLAMGGALGREYLSGYMGMDGETAELVGMLGGIGVEVTPAGKLIRKGVKKVASGTVGVGTGLVKQINTDGILSPIPAFYYKLMNVDRTVDDYDELYYYPRYGKHMNRNERKMVRNAFKQVENMDDPTRDKFLDIIQGQMNLRDELLQAFPEGRSRDAAADFLESSFAEVSTLPSAIAAYQMATEAALLKGVKKGGMGAMLDAAVEMDRKASRAQLLIENFEKHVAEFANPSQTGAVTELLAQTKNSLDNIQQMIDNEFAQLDEMIDTMIEEAASDMTQNLDEDFLEAYIDAKELLARRVSPETSEKVSGLVSDVRMSQAAILNVEKALLERFEQIKAIRDRKTLHTSKLETAVETLMFARYGALSQEMDAAYDDFRDFVAKTDRPNIDISPAVEEMLRLAGGSDKDILTFFGPESTFFSGYLGRKSMKMFNRMVKRTLDELPEDERNEMFTALVEEGVDPGDLEMLLRNDPVRFGLLLHQFGQLNVFARANIEEAEEFRRAFRDYGYKTSNKAVSREFTAFEKVIDKAMETSDPEGYEKLKATRKIYQQLNDPMRPGSPLNRILGSKVGDKVTADSGPYSGMYRGKTPFEIVAEMGETVNDIMAGGRGKIQATAKLREQFRAMEQLFGTVGPDGVMRIDLRTEEGQLALELMEEVIEAIVYDGWAAEFLSRKPKLGQRTIDPRELGFSRSVMDQLEGINEIFNVSVIDKDGLADEVLAFNITNMVAHEQRIEKMVMEGGRFHEAGKKAVRALRRGLKSAKKEAEATAKREAKADQALIELTNTKDSASFYQRYIGKEGFGDLDELRDLFMTRMKQDPEMEGVDLEKLFDNAIYNMTYKGLMEAGGYGPVGRKVSQQIDEAYKEVGGLMGESITVHGFANTLGALAELEDPNVIRNLEKVMPPKQIDNLKNIFDYLATQQAASTALNLQAKGMSANEAISRAYNIARDMVSPQYVISEVAVRMLQKQGSDLLLMALQSPDAARIMEKMLKYPKLVTPRELRTFDTLLQEFFFTEVARKGNELMMTDYFNLYTGEEEPTDEENE